MKPEEILLSLGHRSSRCRPVGPRLPAPPDKYSSPLSRDSGLLHGFARDCVSFVRSYSTSAGIPCTRMTGNEEPKWIKNLPLLFVIFNSNSNSDIVCIHAHATHDTHIHKLTMDFVWQLPQI